MSERSSAPRRGFALGTLLGGLALIAAACGSGGAGGGGGTSGGGGGGAAATPGVTANQIVLGTTTPLTGPAAPGYSEIAPAANAIFKYVNAHGGVYGRQIKYLIENDQYDPSQTTAKTHQLVLQDKIFADVGSLGTPTQLAVQQYLNSAGIPQVFIESGCACWSNPKFPDSFGWQPNYVVEGKILGKYVASHFKGQKVGYLYQNDEFGLDGVKGLSQEIPSSSVVGRQTYVGSVAGLASGLGNQINALKAAGAKVVVLYTIPAATALALLAAAGAGYSPQWVVSSVGSDPPTLKGLLTAFSKGKAGASLQNGMLTAAYLPPESDSSNAWVKLSKGILAKYDPGFHWDGNSEYGAALGYTTVETLEAAGKNLTRADFVSALESKGSTFAASGLVPFAYSKSDHYGFSGSEVVKINNGAISPVSPAYVSTESGPITTYTGGQLPIPSIFKGA